MLKLQISVKNYFPFYVINLNCFSPVKYYMQKVSDS